jgi:hypothetical protein
MRKSNITYEEILSWAESYRELSGQWPTKYCRAATGLLGLTWSAIDRALRVGGRGLRGGASLAQLLAERKGARNRVSRPLLFEEQIVIWAETQHQRTGEWPTENSGWILGSGGESWVGVDSALRKGYRGLPGGSSLPQLLAVRCGKRNIGDLPSLPRSAILEWADAYLQSTGKWPTYRSGPVEEAPGETWLAIHQALSHGQRGLPAGSSLARLLAEERGARNCWSRPNLSVEQVLAWADQHHTQTGAWPHKKSGRVAAAPGETWQAVDHALARGSRGLPGGSSLAKLLARERNASKRFWTAPLSKRLILTWADAYRDRTGALPTQKAGPIPEAPGATWHWVDDALRLGRCRLPGGSSLAELLAQHRGKRNIKRLPPLSYKGIVKWADHHRESTGTWPNLNSGAVLAAPGERWDLIDVALRVGLRHLPGGSTLRQLLDRKRRQRRPPRQRPSRA